MKFKDHACPSFKTKLADPLSSKIRGLEFNGRKYSQTTNEGAIPWAGYDRRHTTDHASAKGTQ
jgi:hypothetical protein